MVTERPERVESVESVERDERPVLVGGVESNGGAELDERMKRAERMKRDDGPVFDEGAERDGCLERDEGAVFDEGAELDDARDDGRDELEPIAVIGMALRVPGARTPEELWRNLRGGVASITRFSLDELRARGAAEAELAAPDFVPVSGVIDDADRFDAALFGMADREAELTNPEKRIFLECAWAALEHAGHDPARAAAPIGVYATATASAFLLDNLHRVAGDERNALFGRDLAALTSDRLGLTGPSLTIDGVCSASLVVTHVACQALLAGECGIALAGGVCLSAPHRWGYLPGGELSPDGSCRAFDAEARGAVPADGVGVLVLRRLRDAVRDGDTIHGVIRGSALSHTGGARVGLGGLVGLVAEAMAIAEVAPRSIGHVELHGAGLLHEEAVELRVVSEAFRRSTADRGFCSIGSVKPNLGHAGPATGMAMLMKVLAMLRAGERPPNLFVRRPNPLVRLETTPFRITPELAPWPRDAGAPRRAGVGVFGSGMCNAYLVLEEPPPAPASALVSAPALASVSVPAPASASAPARRPALLVLSAHTRAALAVLRVALRDHLLAHPDDDPADVAFTLHAGRRGLAHRAALPFGDRAELLAGLAGELEAVEVDVDRAARVVLAFPDGDAGFAGLADDLADTPAFREAHEACVRAAGGALSGTARAIALQIALARTWQAWGVAPAGAYGTGLGARGAAVVTGALPLGDALTHTGVAPSAPGVPDVPDGAIVLVLGPRAGGVPPGTVAVAALAGAGEHGARRAMIDAAAHLWRLGLALDPAGLYRGQRRRRIPLPTYPFAGARYPWRVTPGAR